MLTLILILLLLFFVFGGIAWHWLFWIAVIILVVYLVSDLAGGRRL